MTSEELAELKARRAAAKGLNSISGITARDPSWEDIDGLLELVDQQKAELVEKEDYLPRDIAYVTHEAYQRLQEQVRELEAQLNPKRTAIPNDNDTTTMPWEGH